MFCAVRKDTWIQDCQCLTPGLSSASQDPSECMLETVIQEENTQEELGRSEGETKEGERKTGEKKKRSKQSFSKQGEEKGLTGE